MRKKPTVTIGIPAYNEEANIKNLLKSLLAQKQLNLKIQKIIVISDCSSDKTEEEVKSLKNGTIILLVNNKRLGKALTQNIILKNFSSDYLVLLDADVLPKNSLVIERIIEPFSRNTKIGLVGGKIIPLRPRNLLEKTLFFSREVKLSLFENMNDGNNIYLCHGAFRVFSKDFAKKIKWPAISGEDAYSYLRCLSDGYLFQYEPKAAVYFKFPHRLRGHFSQSVRFLGSRRRLKEIFNENLVDKSFSIPFRLLVTKAFPLVVKNPLQSILYLFIYFYANLMNLFVDKSTAKWEMSLSSKKLAATQ